MHVVPTAVLYWPFFLLTFSVPGLCQTTILDPQVPYISTYVDVWFHLYVTTPPSLRAFHYSMIGSAAHQLSTRRIK